MRAAVTYLFVPGDRPERFAKALASGADRVILDLEDAVRPDQKDAARTAILSADLDRSRVVVRINDIATPFFAQDAAFLGALEAAAVMVPKAQSRATLERVAEALGSSNTELLPQIETVAGLENVADILSHPLARRAVFGHLDFSLDLGAAPEWEPLLYARSRLVALSRLAGAEPPIDSITAEIKDEARLRADTEAARKLGFAGKLLIHPAQVSPVRDVFTPTEAQIDWARRVLAMVSEGGAGAMVIDGKMIDKPVEEAARRILATAGEDEA